MVWRTVAVSAACLRRADASAVIPLSQYRGTYLTEPPDHARIFIAYLYGLINGSEDDFLPIINVLPVDTLACLLPATNNNVSRCLVYSPPSAKQRQLYLIISFYLFLH